MRSLGHAIEQLESRQYLSVSTDANGWTVVTPSIDSHVIYVSSSTGSDSNTGTSPTQAFKTIAKGMTKIRSGFPDELLLARGDTFTANLFFSGGGRSPTEPMLVSNYGDPTLPRPIVDATTDVAVDLGPLHYLDIIGIDFTSSTHDPTSPNFINNGSYGIQDIVPTDTFLIEDCRFRNFVQGANFQGDNTVTPNIVLSNIVFRRNQVVDNYTTSGNSQGIYSEMVNGLTIQENLFDHDGWNTLVPGASANQFSQEVYINSTTSGVVVTGNVFANAAANGLEARSGGIIDNNLFLSDPSGMTFGLVNGATATPGGVTGEVLGNVFLKSRDISGTPLGLGMDLGNLKPGGNVVVANNFFGEDTQGVNAAITFEPGIAVSNGSQEVGVNTLTVQNNIVKSWGYALEISNDLVPGGTGQNALNGLVVRNNAFQGTIRPQIIDQATLYDPRYEDFSGNLYSDTSPQSSWFQIQGANVSFATWESRIEPVASATTVPYVNGTRDVESYMASMGITATTDAFLAALRGEMKGNWNTQLQAAAVNSYILAGYVSDTTAPTPALAPVANITTDTTPTQTFTVTYSDDFSVNNSTIATGNLLVTGPNGFSQVATLVSSAVANGPTITATYSITAPNNTWTSLSNGTYVVALQAGQVKDTSGNTIAAQNLGSFILALGSSSAGGSTAATPVGFAASASGGTITLNWSDPANDQLGFILQRALDPGFSIGVKSFPLTANATAYSDATAAVGKTYYYELIATNSVGFSLPTPISSAVILPAAPALQSTIFNDGNALQTTVTAITLIFTQPVTVDTTKISLVSHATGLLVPVAVSNPTGDGKTWVVGFPLTGGINGTLNDDSYDLNVFNSRITDAFAQNAGTNSTRTFTVDVAPRVVSAVYSNSAPPHSLSFTFSKDVSKSLSTSTLTIKNGSTSYPPTAFAWNAGTLTGTWTYSGAFPDNSSSYTATLSHLLVHDAAGVQIDGNGDGIAGDDYTFNFKQAKPSITLSAASPVLVNTAVNLTFGSVNDPGQAPSAYLIHWGDGATSTFTTTGSASHTYTAAGVYTVTTDITDLNGTHTGAGSMSIQVNRALISLSGNKTNANVNGVYTLTLGAITGSTLPPISYVVHWGDGTSGTFTTASPYTHTYTKTGSDTISVDLVDSLGTSTNAGSMKVSVNLSPTLSPTGNFKANLNGVYRLVLGNASDPGYSVTQYLVHWGDGTTTTVSTNANPLTHVYATTGAKTITVDLTDSTGSFTSAGSLAIAVDSAPTLTLNGNSTNVQGLVYTLTPGTLIDPGYAALSYVIHWGDGTTNSYLVGDPMSHVYSATGAMNVSVDVTDSTGTYLSAGSKPIIVNPAQAIFVTADSGDDSFYLKMDADQQTVDVWLNSSTPGAGKPTFQFPSPSAMTLSGGPNGNDTFTVDESAGAINLPGGVTLSGNSTGNNSVLVLDTAGNDTVNMTDGAMTFDNGQLYWLSIPSIAYNVSAGNDTTSLSGATPLVMNVGQGNETINVSAGSNVTLNLNNSNGNFVINGGGNTTINFGDSNPSMSFNAAIPASSVAPSPSSTDPNSGSGSSTSSVGGSVSTATSPTSASSAGGSGQTKLTPAPTRKAPPAKPAPIVHKKPPPPPPPPVVKPVVKKVVVPPVKSKFER